VADLLSHPSPHQPTPLSAITPQWPGVQPITPSTRPRHMMLSPEPTCHDPSSTTSDIPSPFAAHHEHLWPHDDHGDRDLATDTPTNTATQTVPSPDLSPSSPDDVRFPCGLLLRDGSRCTECFDVDPTFVASSPYGKHVILAHHIDLRSDAAGLWVCTLQGCTSTSATTRGVQHRLAHIRTHVGRHFKRTHTNRRLKCTECSASFGRKSSLDRHLKRHQEKSGGSGAREGRARKRAKTLPRSFDCPDCGRRLDSAEDLSYHQVWEECVAGPSG
jgi:hypothetical protein